MWGVRVAFVGVLALPLAGCFSVMLPPKELPEWAMNPQASNVAPEPANPRAARRAKQKGQPDQTANASYARDHMRGQSAQGSRTPDVKPFSAEWQAREDAADNKLRRTMSICGNC